MLVLAMPAEVRRNFVLPPGVITAGEDGPEPRQASLIQGALPKPGPAPALAPPERPRQRAGLLALDPPRQIMSTTGKRLSASMQAAAKSAVPRSPVKSE